MFNVGSLAHPEFCGPPCAFIAAGKCGNGATCGSGSLVMLAGIDEFRWNASNTTLLVEHASAMLTKPHTSHQELQAELFCR